MRFAVHYAKPIDWNDPLCEIARDYLLGRTLSLSSHMVNKIFHHSSIINNIKTGKYSLALFTDDKQFITWIDKDNFEDFKEKYLILL